MGDSSINVADEVILKSAINCLQIEADSLIKSISRLDVEFVKIVRFIASCKGKVITTGVGKSGHIASKIAATLASTGTPSFYLNPLDAYHGDLGMISDDDIVIAISYSGRTEELLRFIPILVNRNIPIIGFSGVTDSLLFTYSTFFLNIFVEKEADPLNLVPTSSTTLTLAIGDALACALMTLRNFNSKDFARFHPGGTLGRMLMSKVSDFMVSEDLPIVNPNSKALETLFEISRNKMGIAVVIENDNIVGVVTDGDIRRALLKDSENFMSLVVKDVMCNKPKVINENESLTNATNIMKMYNIKSLVVVDDSSKLKGIIDYFVCI